MCASLFFATSSHAVPVVDQQHLDGDTFTLLGLSRSSIGQTFTVGQTGILTGIDIYVRNTGGFLGGLTVDIRDATGGVVEPLAANALGSVAVANGAISTTLGSFTPLFVDFSSAGISVTAGDELAFLATPAVSGDRFSLEQDLAGGYLGGEAVGQFAADGDGSPFSPVAASDLTFTTYVDPEIAPVPLPAGGALLLLGLAGLVAARRRTA